jgi:putative glutamine amidotransferase
MTGRPLIGVTTSEVRQASGTAPTPEGEPPRKEMALGLIYLRAIEAAGGLPVVLPPLTQAAVRPLVGHLHGLCLSGGPDLDPSGYGAEPHPRLGPTEPDLDRFELAAARCADAAGLPILAICRGLQAINVARGGTLHQHVPEHRQEVPGDQPTHPVSIAPGSRLASLTGATELEVNSFHHQAVETLGRGLRAVAWSPDGFIEALEAPRRTAPLVAVQWHAECMADRAEHAALFADLVAAAAEYRAPAIRAA